MLKVLVFRIRTIGFVGKVQILDNGITQRRIAVKIIADRHVVVIPGRDNRLPPIVFPSHLFLIVYRRPECPEHCLPGCGQRVRFTQSGIVRTQNRVITVAGPKIIRMILCQAFHPVQDTSHSQGIALVQVIRSHLVECTRLHLVISPCMALVGKLLKKRMRLLRRFLYGQFVDLVPFQNEIILFPHAGNKHQECSDGRKYPSHNLLIFAKIQIITR